MERKLVWWIALGAALAPLLFMAYMTASCPSGMPQVESTEAGQAPGPSSCAPGIAPQLFIFGPLILANVAAVLLRRPDAALATAVLFVGLSFLFGFSMGFLVPFALVSLIAAIVWKSQERGSMQLRTAVLVLSIAIGGFGLLTIALESPQLFDPCHTWGFEGGSLQTEGSQGLRPGGSNGCISSSSGSETRAGFLLRLGTIDGLFVVGGALAAWGAWRRDATLQILGAGVFAAQAITVTILYHWIVAILPGAAAILVGLAGRAQLALPPPTATA